MILHQITIKPDSVLVFQLSKPNASISKTERENTLLSLKTSYPNNSFIIIGNDINLYEVVSEDSVLLKLKGIV